MTSDRGATRALAAIVLACCGMIPASASAEHTNCHSPDCDPAPCSGTIGGDHTFAHIEDWPVRIQIPVLAPGFIVPLTDQESGPFYLDVRDVLSHISVFSVWLYQETNSVAVLQRGGHSIFPDTPATSYRDNCTEAGGAEAMTCDTLKPSCHDQAVF